MKNTLKWAVGLCLVAVLGLTEPRVAFAEPGVVKACKTLVGAIRYNKDEMALTQMAGVSQGEFLAGDFWEKATPEQQTGFIRNFHALFAALVFPQVRENFEHLETVVYGEPVISGNRATIPSTIVILHALKKQEIVVTYELTRGEDKGWQIHDVTVKGDSSMLTRARDEQVQPLLAKRGWEGLLAAMEARLQKLEKK